MATGIRSTLMRGGTSKGAFFLAADLPSDIAVRDRVLLEIMGSPDPTQIDGVGGAHPLRSKVAIVSPSTEPGVDLDYLFLQVSVDEAVVADLQTCGNMLAAVGPFAVERGLIPATGDRTIARIRLINTGDLAIESFPTRDGMPVYDGDTAIDGVPGTAAAIEIEMGDESTAKELFPTGTVVDDVAGHRVTLIDNGMPVVLLDAAEFGVAGDESPVELEERGDLTAVVEAVRLEAGRLMGLGDVADQTVPKMFLLSAPRHGGTIGTRGFIPHQVHTSIGVLMAASIAAAAKIPGTVAAGLATSADAEITRVEHPSGTFDAKVRVFDADGTWRGTSTSIRTARKLFDGIAFPRSY
ncbi:4-oxalomesaconate tautomerase [Pseudolysinimonas sp.]|jgi:4-oxalomesaconate tautomerase|uniref:4-oxalomesaconate tautomerase n=1 Tax=Pseudolysinimonas sp. TaxID=2680009 RepID=UPI00378330D1